MNEIDIRKGYVPGAIGRIAELHGTYYHAHWGFGVFFEAKVAGGLAEFMNRYDDRHDGLWTTTVNGRIEGSIAIDAAHATQEGAHLRWFIVSDALRGQGVGKRLIDVAITFCRMKNTRVFTSGPLRGCTQHDISMIRQSLCSLNSIAAPSGGQKSRSNGSNCAFANGDSLPLDCAFYPAVCQRIRDHD